jgi:hypothetical protein
MRLVVKRQCIAKIVDFYHHVARKYKHTYSKELMHKNIDDAIDSMYQIERTLLRRQPSVKRWLGLNMANTDTWYFAYTIENDTIIIVDACHAQNMHDEE